MWQVNLKNKDKNENKNDVNKLNMIKKKNEIIVEIVEFDDYNGVYNY